MPRWRPRWASIWVEEKTDGSSIRRSTGSGFQRRRGKRRRGLGPAVGRRANDLVGSPEVLAETLFTRYVVPFEAVSMLLLAAILGTVVLSRKQTGEPN